MICQNCKKNTANTHITQLENGQLNEIYLCSECAFKLGKGVINKFNFGLSDLLGGIFSGGLSQGSSNNIAGEKECSNCHITFSQLAKSGKAGCPVCYTDFYKELLPSLRQLHGKTVHSGKVPQSAEPKLKIKAEIERLKAQLKTAIQNEEYELAARLRDNIKNLEKAGDQ